MTYHMPAEWTPHERCWMAWPTEETRDTYQNLDAMRTQYAEIASVIAEFESVRMLSNANTFEDARRQCSSKVEVTSFPLDDAWLRDTGPTFVKHELGNLAGVDWQFNCWGKLNPRYATDAKVARRILASVALKPIEAPIYLEGGAIHSDGEGTLLTTGNVVLNRNRNPDLTQEEAEEIFHSLLGVKKVIWLDTALEYDDTDGHVDNLACFSKPGQVIALTESNPNDSNFSGLNTNLETLRLNCDALDRPLEVVKIHQPARQDYRGARIPLSYINFYMANGGIVMPGFDDKMDKPALEVIRSIFPDRDVVQVPGIEVAKGGGCIHCITQQQPAT